MPMVVMNEGVNESSLKRSKQHDFPTPESPISRSLICGGVSTLELRQRGGVRSYGQPGCMPMGDLQGSHSFLSRP